MYLPNLAVSDTRYAPPSGAAVDDAPYGIGDRRVWRAPTLVTGPGAPRLALEPGGVQGEPPDKPPVLPKLSAAVLARLA